MDGYFAVVVLVNPVYSDPISSPIDMKTGL
jgi:hypothetical protein